MKYTLSTILLFSSFVAFSQNLDKIGKKDMAKVTGGMSANFVYNKTVNQPQFRDPLSWVYSGNITVNLLDVSLPFTFSFSNTGKSYSQPFNMTAIHPSYKNIKTHIGITSMSFSPYTYSGMNFAGGGVEYTPGKWNVKAFGGRLKKAVEYNPQVDNLSTVSYKRMGYGLGVGYKGNKWGTELILFKANDDPTSLTYTNPNTELTAMDNFVVSLLGNVSLFKSLRLKTEVASSILTQNVLNDDPGFKVTNIQQKLVNGNQSTTSNNAYNASLDYRFKKFGIGVKYERIDPNYKTLGAVYFNNDIENVTLTPSFTLFKNKVNISGSTGFQRNNLDRSNATDNKRWIGNANLSAQLIKGLTMNVSYSNMSSFSKKNPAADPFYTTIGDTLNYYQTSENSSASLNYIFGKKVKQSVSTTGSYSKSTNITGRLQDAAAFGFNVQPTANTTPVDVYNGLFSHNIQISKKAMTIGWTVNGNHSVMRGMTNTFIGPGLNMSKSVKEKGLNFNVGGNYNQQYQQNVLVNHVLNLRMGLRYSPKYENKKIGRSSISMNGNWTNKFAVGNNTTNSQNITVIVNLSHQF